MGFELDGNLAHDAPGIPCLRFVFFCNFCFDSNVMCSFPVVGWVVCFMGHKMVIDGMMVYIMSSNDIPEASTSLLLILAAKQSSLEYGQDQSIVRSPRVHSC